MYININKGKNDTINSRTEIKYKRDIEGTLFHTIYDCINAVSTFQTFRQSTYS